MHKIWEYKILRKYLKNRTRFWIQDVIRIGYDTHYTEYRLQDTGYRIEKYKLQDKRNIYLNKEAGTMGDRDDKEHSTGRLQVCSTGSGNK